MSHDNDVVNQIAADPPSCCKQGDILCVSIPCTTTIVVLGLTLTLGPICIRLASGSTLTAAQVAQVLGSLTTVLTGIAQGLQE